MNVARAFIVVSALAAVAPHPAAAHGFGMRYDLPLPLDYFIVGGAAAVFFTFVVAALFLRPRSDPASYPTLKMPGIPYAGTILRALGVIAFSVTILAGFFGAPSPYKNISVVMVWVIGWVGIAFASALIGNVWVYLNPWSTLFAWAERAGKISLDLPYPSWLGAWPAVASLFVFAWLEINWSGSGIPLNVAIALTAFSILTWTGMVLFGRATWAQNGGMFVMIFALFARFAIFEIRDGAVRLRPPVVGLLASRPASFSEIVFVILILATVTYDGFTETELFQSAALALFSHLQGLGTIAVPIVSTIGLVSFPFFFVVAYYGVMVLVRWSGGNHGPLGMVSGTLVYSLVPIAIAYHLAHYMSLLVFEGQNAIALISDPFGFGWNLFGTAHYRVDITVMNAEFLWFFSVAVIVIGHIAAVYLAHAEAMRLFATRQAALVSQLPMLVLMVGYTMLSLWIVAQPIVA